LEKQRKANRNDHPEGGYLNIGDYLNPLHLSPLRRIGINPALDLGQALVVAVNHAGDCDRASDDDGYDRNQQGAQTQN
jgi:hypothetical protein